MDKSLRGMDFILSYLDVRAEGVRKAWNTTDAHRWEAQSVLMKGICWIIV